MDIRKNEDRTISLMLSHVMEDIGVTKEMVNRRRRTFLEKEAILSLSEILLGLKTISYNFGSQSEATTTLGMDSDLDLLNCLNSRPVILSMEDWNAGKDNLLLLRDQQTPPQHCYLQRLSSKSPEPMTNVPMSDHVKDNKGRVLIQNTWFSSSAQRQVRKVRKKFIKHGPSVSYSDNVDYVFCFHCQKVPDVCRSWVSRYRPGHWPPTNVKMMAMSAGIFLLACGHPESEQEPMEWRFSTSAAERLLMFDLSLCQIKVLVLLKMIRKTYLKKTVGDGLTTYHLKTALLYTIENYPPDVWKEDNLLQCAINCLTTLARWLRLNYVPHYTMEGVNLLTGKLKKHELPHLENIVLNMIDTKLQCVLGIEMDTVGDRLWTLIHKGWYSSEQFASRESIEFAIIAFLAEEYFGNLNHSLNQYMAAANKVSFDQAHSTIKSYLSVLAKGLLNSDPIKRDATKLLIKYLNSVVATMQASQCLRNGVPIMLPDTVNLFNVSLDFDLASCKLKLASVYYCMKEYRKAEDILSKVEHSFQPWVLSACDCRKRTMKKPTKAFDRRALAHTNQDMLRSSVTMCVKILRHEMECVPKHLHFEMYRATCNDDLQLRDPWHDIWMDMALVDSLPFTYYLQYLTYRELGLEDAQIESVEKLADYVEKYNGYGHIETVCNLVGHCYELEGLFDQALGWYLESLHVLPRNNAAMWHIILLLYSLFKRGMYLTG
ncbi:uncharacterized protein LOC128546301 [Mercenaria mercenaria]|uniref:uncharacterized protein LOC128546301 n=1 Tax=Mercenaria mercenaria TaxID=6596 RepID=UPI00234F3943|nr:uncharacterized protein LOC128546301 [Mercenaria mercenaria]